MAISENESKSMPESEDINIREVQTAPLRRQRADKKTVIVSISEAIRAAGLEDGGSFRFDPSSVEEVGMLAAIGSEETVDGRSERYARNIRREGAGKHFDSSSRARRSRSCSPPRASTGRTHRR